MLFFKTAELAQSWAEKTNRIAVDLGEDKPDNRRYAVLIVTMEE